MKKNVMIGALVVGALLAACSMPVRQQISLVSDAEGSRLTVDGKPLFIKGMNWDYFPVGTNWAYSLWRQPDEVIRAALDREMTMLQEMGVNAIRQYASIPPRWVQYIYEKYGIYTMINHSFGRYGLIFGGHEYDHTDYCREDMREELLREAEAFARTYKDTPGVLLYLIGNENNYGLFWSGAESEDLPVGGQAPASATGGSCTQGDSTCAVVTCARPEAAARCMYALMNEAAQRVKAIDPSRPVAICNGDLLFLDIIAEACPDVDVLGVNCYRGESFDSLFAVAKQKYGKPVLFTEFGADALNAITKEEAQAEQADILLSNWQEIYLNAAGNGLVGNCLGGFTFQFSDGWWKYDQKKNLDIHDTHASWANGGYKFDYIEGENNMNEEWFGICAKGRPDDKGLYELQPRMAYQVLREVHQMDPYEATPTEIVKYFEAVRKQLSE